MCGKRVRASHDGQHDPKRAQLRLATPDHVGYDRQPGSRNRVIGSLGHRVIGSLGHWVIESLGHWVIGSLDGEIGTRIGAIGVQGMNWRGMSAGILVAALGATALAQNKVDVVKVSGCLRLQGPDNWMLVAATEPELSTANAPARGELPKEPPTGKNQFKLIGVSEFNLPQFKDHTVLVKA